jgi:hypothetical protein
MSSDELLDGKAGPEAQANEVLRLLNEDMAEAIRGLALTSGNSRSQTAGRSVSVQEGGES